MKVLYVILVSYASAGLAQAALMYAYRSNAAQKYMISDDAHRSKTDRELYWRVALNITVSVTLIFSVMFGLGDYLYYDHAAPAWRYALEAVTVVLIYDFGYYFMHRYPFHEWKLLRGVHSVHHAARNPGRSTASCCTRWKPSSGSGCSLARWPWLAACTSTRLGALFTAYTALNILNHAGIDVPHFPFKTLGVLAAKHDRHHHSMLSGNYASITPLPDIIFGTVE